MQPPRVTAEPASIVPTESDTARPRPVTIPESVDLTSARTLLTSAGRGQGRTGPRMAPPNGSAASKWTANNLDNGWKRNRVQVFMFRAEKWPTGVDSVSLPTEQRYSDGTVVRSGTREYSTPPASPNIRHRR